MTQLQEKKTSIVWDLGDLYASIQDPRIEQDKAHLSQWVCDFESRFRDQIVAPALTAGTLAEALAHYTRIVELSHDLMVYSILIWNVAMQDTAITAFKDQVAQFLTELSTRLEFFRLELIAVPAERMDRLLLDPAIDMYREYLRTTRQFKPYALSEAEERVLTLEQQYARQRWIEFYTQTSSQWTFTVQGQDLTEDEAMDYMRKTDPALRQAGYRAVYEKYGENIAFCSYIYNTLIQEHATEARLRGFSSTLAFQAFHQQLDAESVGVLLEQMRSRNHYFQRYYKQLARSLGQEKLRSCDISAPCSTLERQISYPEGQEIILNALQALDPELAEQTSDFFRRNWIHGDMYKGKASGAFCAPTAKLHPYVLLNWNNNLYSLTALAHELGHGLHFYQTGRHQHILHLMPPLFLAETASTFNEYLLAEYMLKHEQDPELQLYFISDLLQRMLNGLYRQSLISDFETRAHEAGKQRTLAEDEISQLWMELTLARNGDAIETLPEEKYGWSRIQHIFLYPFYCYNYTLSNVIVLSIIYQYQHDPGEFMGRYRQFLQAGGGQSPAELLGILNLNLRDENFYEHAFQVLEEMLSEFEDLQKKI